MANKHKLGTGHRKHFPSRTQTCHSAPVKAKQWLRRYEAMSWRARGLNFAEIGAKMGVSRQKATDLVYGGFAEVAPTATLDKVRREETHRLELLQRTYFGKAEAGDIDAANLCLKISKLRAELHGVARQPSSIVNVGGDINVGKRWTIQGVAADATKNPTLKEDPPPLVIVPAPPPTPPRLPAPPAHDGPTIDSTDENAVRPIYREVQPSEPQQPSSTPLPPSEYFVGRKPPKKPKKILDVEEQRREAGETRTQSQLEAEAEARAHGKITFKYC